MIGWIILAAWVLGALAMFRPTARGLCNDSVGRAGIEWEDVVFGAMLGGIICVFAWPLVAGYFLLRHRFAGDADRAARLLFGETQDAKVQRLEREKSERDLRIAALERELQIGDR